MGLETKAGDMGVVTTSLETVANWGRTNAMWPLLFGLACCAIEMMGTGAPHYDIARFGMEVFRASPRQADIMIVAGRVSQKMAPVLRQVYDQMMEPKWVISMGVCASSGGMFNNYAIVQGVDQIVPVDVYAPGCPPTPETLIHAIETLHQLIEDGEIPRYRDVESEITVSKNTTTITTIFTTRSGAEKWADWVDNDGTALVSIAVVED
jgi:NADH-quinone oxidoreductase subunit B